MSSVPAWVGSLLHNGSEWKENQTTMKPSSLKGKIKVNCVGFASAGFCKKHIKICKKWSKKSRSSYNQVDTKSEALPVQVSKKFLKIKKLTFAKRILKEEEGFSNLEFLSWDSDWRAFCCSRPQKLKEAHVERRNVSSQVSAFHRKAWPSDHFNISNHKYWKIKPIFWCLSFLETFLNVSSPHKANSYRASQQL